MYLNVCVWKYTCNIYIYIYVYIYTCAYVCVCVCMCMCMFLSLLLSLFVCLCVGLLVCMYVRRALGPSQLRQLLQLSYKCTQLNSSISNCSWAMILEQRSGLNPTQLQSQAKQPKRCCHTTRVGNISIAILKSLPCNPVVQCPAVHPVEGRTPHCFLIATSSAQSPREWLQRH